MRKRVLVIDDDEAVRDIVLMLLELVDYKVVIAEDGLDALKKLETMVPDLILLDLLMPRMDGFEFIRRLRRQGGHYASIPVIAFTASRPDQHTIGQMEFTDLIQKPFNLEELLQKISTLCNTPFPYPFPAQGR